MLQKTSNRTLNLVNSAVIAALYVALTLLFAPIAYGPIQFRVSEALVILPFFTTAAVPGVTIGCFLANLLIGAPVPDIVFGTLATLIGAVISYRIRHLKWLVCFPPIISNMVIIPWVLKFAYQLDDLIPFMMLTVGIGEFLAVGVLGNLLLAILSKIRQIAF